MNEQRKIETSELLSVETDHYVQQTKYIVNSNQLEASVAEELMKQRRTVKQDHRTAKEANWSVATTETLLASLTQLKNRLDSLGEDTHLKAVELFRKVRAERNADYSLEGNGNAE